MRMMSKILAICMLIAILNACGTDISPTVKPTSILTNSIKVTPQLSSSFVLQSSEVVEGGILSKDYTCDGTSATLPLSWSGVPNGTQEFAVIMHHTPETGDSHWYWTLYNIPANVNSLERNVRGIGTLGNNSVNKKTEYSPPCSKGPGMKVYTYTIYALSDSPKLTVPPAQVNRDTLLEAIKNNTLASATLNVSYSR
ncbi:YbhB/YbcL family Raf kinase inhibitor-like protein [Candidatus Chlorohelix sp.]|uniref:YbhB/YbcL family Raf kinase inhibitor-like protein n=1 Tax=Candidatus Chlorohelix sp. TaxID=3139201 RepID=UPI003028C889